VIYQLMPRWFTNNDTTRKPYGTIEENGCGKFNQIDSSSLRYIRNLGATHVWYTGILEHATMTGYSRFGITPDNPLVVKGRAGSPYAVKDYYDVDPDLAENVPERMAEWDALIARTHEAGLRVLMDFVPNHVARDYRSDSKPEGVVDLGAGDDTSRAFDPNNNFYYLPGRSFRVPEGYDPLPLDSARQYPSYRERPAKATGNNVFKPQPSVDDWFETVKLNYGIDYLHDKTEHFDPVPDTWHKMLDILLFWAGKGVDGFRCDMAEMVPVAFWEWALPQVKAKYPGIIFIAEIYNPDAYETYLEQGHFDYLYDKTGMYDNLRAVIEGRAGIPALSMAHAALSETDSQLLRFLENHDEQRIASRFFAGDPWKAVPAMGVTAALGKGPVMIYAAQELGEPAEEAEGFGGDDGRTTIFDYWSLPTLQPLISQNWNPAALDSNTRTLHDWYAALLKLVSEQEVFATGKCLDLSESLVKDPPEAPVFAWARFTGKEVLICIAHFGDTPAEISLQLSGIILQALGMENLPATVRHLFGNSEFDNESLVLESAPWGFDILRLK